MIWAGTDGGLVKVPVASQSFRRYLDNSNPMTRKNSLACGEMYENKKGDIYIGTYNGLYLLNPKDNSLKRFLIGNNTNTIPYRIIPVDDHTLMMTTIHDGLQYFDQLTGLFSPAAAIVDPLDRELYGLFKDSDGIFWVGTRKGLRQFDKKEHTLVKFVDDSQNEAILSSYVYDIREFPKGILWVGTSKGLLKIDKITGKVKHYTVQSTPHLSNKEILSITPGSDNTLWVASYGGGLMKLDVIRDSIKYINTADGLSSSIVYGLIPDGQYVWASTEDGISGMDIATLRFKNYHEKDGLTDNEFNSAAYLKASDGRIYFGGINGVNAFDPHELVEEKTIDKIILTSLKRGNLELVNDLSVMAKPNITLPYDDRNLSVQLPLLIFIDPRKSFPIPDQRIG